MSNKSLAKSGEFFPAAMEDFFKPWNEWFGNGGLLGKSINVPAVNITSKNISVK